MYYCVFGGGDVCVTVLGECSQTEWLDTFTDINTDYFISAAVIICWLVLSLSACPVLLLDHFIFYFFLSSSYIFIFSAVTPSSPSSVLSLFLPLSPSLSPSVTVCLPAYRNGSSRSSWWHHHFSALHLLHLVSFTVSETTSSCHRNVLRRILYINTMYQGHSDVLMHHYTWDIVCVQFVTYNERSLAQNVSLLKE